LLPWAIVLCSILISVCCCVAVCTCARREIVYNCDVEPDPNVVGKEFHAEWLRECNRLNRRQRASRRGNLSAIAFDGTTTERLLGRAE
jgi:hypothetical protein